MIEREEKVDDMDFEKVKSILKSQKNGKHTPNYIYRMLHGKDNLRRVYLSLIKHSPAKISDIFEESLLTKPTCYTQLFKLIELQICDRIFVMPIMNGTVKNDEIKEKFTDWTKTMPDNLKRYYLAKTSFWVITEYGKQFAGRAYKFENEFREKIERSEK